jgi:hypothetical protein
METENTQPEATGQSQERTIGGFIKQVYSPPAYIFIGINILAFVVLFFVLSSAIGGIGMKIFTFAFCIVVGGLLGVRWSMKKNADEIAYFRGGAGTLLVMVVGLAWMNDGYTPKFSSSSTAEDHTCIQCGDSYRGYGWMSVGGEQYQPSSDNGDQYCSRECAYNSQARRWKN